MVVEQVTLDIDGMEVVVDRLDDGTFRKPTFLAGRPVIGTSRGVTVEDDQGFGGIARGGVGIVQTAVDIPVTVGASDEAKQFEGWGTALKPAFEPFIIGRKPLT